ncbi:Ig-like domain-containing protein [Cellulomonas sp. HZM]|uniref:Ig-like domain-containing protein n=1 Tax=Cellulomonas sp. HZM TaxID=1454010 RepID=UPI00069058A5|nr:Ig-like domain-containing protein [Cellulomonas sp. HZM]
MPVSTPRPLRRLVAVAASLGVAAAGAVVVAPAAHADFTTRTSCHDGTCTVDFNANSGLATWEVPAGVTSVEAVLVGGDAWGHGGAGGSGGVVRATVPVTPGSTLVGRVGLYAAANGYGGGTDGESGGGTFLSDAHGLLLVAGGGGAGGTRGHAGGDGGGGLTLVGEPGAGEGGGGGGTLAAAGAGGADASDGTGPATTSTFGVGGAGAPGADDESGAAGGAGGGGYFGGGGGGTVGESTYAGGGGGSGYAAPGLTLHASGTDPSTEDGMLALTYDEPAVTSTSTIALSSAHAVAGGSASAVVTVTANGATDFAGGAVQLLVDGSASGSPVAVHVDGSTATATLPVPATKVGVHQVSARFTADDAALGSTTPTTPFTVLPASLPWKLTDDAGKAVTNPVSTPELVARGSGQLPGSVVTLQLQREGQWLDLDDQTVGADGTFAIDGSLALLLGMVPDEDGNPVSVALRVVATYPDVAGAAALTGATRTATVEPVQLPIDLQVDPGPYRVGAGVDNAVRVKLTWLGEDLGVAGSSDIADMVKDGSLVLLLDGTPVKASDLGIGADDDETAVLTLSAPQRGGDHTVQVVAAIEDLGITGRSEVKHFTVAPDTFDAALLDADGNEVTQVHPGDTVYAAAGGLLPGTKVSFELHSTPVDLGSATTDADGTAIVETTVPDVEAGTHTLVVTATDPLGDVHVEKVSVTVLAATDPTAAPTPPLAATGSDTAPLVGAGAALVALGAGLLLLARRRRLTDR